MIKLPTHDRSNNYLEDLGNNKYKLHAQYGEYGTGVTYNDDGSILTIDPPGGPFMAIGEFKVNGKVLKSIDFDNGAILEFE